jgi:hypothetical protein
MYIILSLFYKLSYYICYVCIVRKFIFIMYTCHIFFFTMSFIFLQMFQNFPVHCTPPYHPNCIFVRHEIHNLGNIHYTPCRYFSVNVEIHCMTSYYPNYIFVRHEIHN